MRVHQFEFYGPWRRSYWNMLCKHPKTLRIEMLHVTPSWIALMWLQRPPFCVPCNHILDMGMLHLYDMNWFDVFIKFPFLCCFVITFWTLKPFIVYLYELISGVYLDGLSVLHCSYILDMEIFHLYELIWCGSEDCLYVLLCNHILDIGMFHPYELIWCVSEDCLQ